MRQIESIIGYLILMLFVWIIVSFGVSAIKADLGNCGKTYPVESSLYANAFCEIKTEVEDD
jgi:hypothetical protein